MPRLCPITGDARAGVYREKDARCDGWFYTAGMIRLLLALAIAFPIAAQNPAVDVLHYRIEVAIAPSLNEITASTELTVRPLVSPLDALDLDFAGLTIDEVTVEGNAATPRREGDRLTIPLALQGNEPFHVLVRYHGRPLDGLFLQTNRVGDPSVFADNWPNRAHFWFPSVDHPSDKASVEEIVTAPAAFEVIGNGAKLETTALADGRKRTSWSEPTPIPVHCMVIGATPFSVVRAGTAYDVEILYYLYPGDAAAGAAQLGRVAQIASFYGEVVGPYPYDKLALVESSTRFGGMENASAIFLDEKRFDGARPLEELAAHEIAHQWFGDSVSQRDWHDLWLSEGFATYFEHLFYERAAGRESFLARMREDRQAYLAANRTQSRPIFDPAVTDLFTLLNRFNYEKGAWVLHMLRGIMGDAAFFAGIRDYYDGHRDANASTGELRVIMERHAHQPLDWFFRQWIFEPGHPVLATKWTWNDGKVVVEVEQKQTGAVFRVPMTIAIGETRERVVIDERLERFEFAAPTSPGSVVLDPDEWVLKELVPTKRRAN